MEPPLRDRRGWNEVGLTEMQFRELVWSREKVARKSLNLLAIEENAAG